MPTDRRKPALIRGGLTLALLALQFVFGTGQLSAQPFLSAQAGRMFAGSGTDLTTAVAPGPDGSAIFVGRFQGTITGTGGSVTSSGSQDVFVTKVQPDGATAWLKSFGGSGLDSADCVAVDAASGNVYLGGFFEGTISFPRTNLTAQAAFDGFLACLESDGDFLWVRQMKGLGDENVNDVKVSPAGVYVCGRYTRSFDWGTLSLATADNKDHLFLALTDLQGVPASGTYVASTQSLQPRQMAVLPDGAVVVAGRFAGSAFVRLSSGSADDLFLVAFEPVTYQRRWTMTGGGTGQDEATSVVTRAAGGVLVGMTVDGGGQITDGTTSQNVPLAGAGFLIWHVSAAGAATPLHAVSGPDLAAVAEGRRGVVHVAGNFSSSFTLGSSSVNPPEGQPSVFLASYLVSGELAGVATVSGTSTFAALDMTAISGDGIAVAGLGTGNLKYQGQELAAGSAGLDAFSLLLGPPEIRLQIGRVDSSVRLTYPAYYSGATLWESSTLDAGSWSLVPGSATLAVGEYRHDRGASDMRKFFQLRYSAP